MSSAPNSASSEGKENSYMDLNARKKSVVVQEKSNSVWRPESGVDGLPTDRVTANVKGSILTVEGISVLERSRETLQVKKGVLSSPITYRRKKASRPETPKWQWVLSILTKNCLLLAALLWMGQTFWTWTHGSRGGSPSQYAALDFEGRISDVEASLKKSVKMLQLQLDAADKKADGDINLVARQFATKFEENEALFREEFRRLEARTDSIGRSLDEVKDLGLLSKAEFESFLDDLRSSSGNGDVTLDDIRSFAREIVKQEIDKHAADGLGRVDFALYSGGGRVVGHSAPYHSGKSKSWISAAKGVKGIDPNAHKMLEPSFGEPGQCFPLEGSNGFIEIRLRAGIIPEAFTLEHVSKAVAYDRSSAPKDFKVLGWFEATNDDIASRAAKTNVLAEFSYDLEKSNVQTFEAVAASPGLINTVRLEFESNHGNPLHTCIYRFRVHGREPSSNEFDL